LHPTLGPWSHSHGPNRSTACARDRCPAIHRHSIAAHPRHCFEWLVSADASPMHEELAGLRSLGIERICSSYGVVIEGTGLVAAVLERTIAALDMLSSERLEH
jgi:hypothetical protein